MRCLTIILVLLLSYGCAENPEKVTVAGIPETKDTTSCDKTALDFLKLNNKHTRADFFHQLDSVIKVQFPNNDHEPAIFVDLTPKLLDKLLQDLDKDQLAKTGNFEKEYYFNTAPPQYSDSRKCKDKIYILFDKQTCHFIITIHNEFVAEGCQESAVIYSFQIIGDKISSFQRNLAG